jgi:hypothetical protein
MREGGEETRPCERLPDLVVEADADRDLLERERVAPAQHGHSAAYTVRRVQDSSGACVRRASRGPRHKSTTPEQGGVPWGVSGGVPWGARVGSHGV